MRNEIYDTTLRDGAQRAGLQFSVEDKLKVLHALDSIGVPYVEGGWPGANPRDTEFFRLAAQERLQHSTLTAFGMTRRAGEPAAGSPVLRDVMDAGTSVVCLVGKSWDLHVTEALRTTLDENLAMVADSVALLVDEGRRAFFDAEHFFDGYRRNPTYALAVLRAAEEAGAERLVLCDTNGGTLPHEASRIVDEVLAAVSTPMGVHFHNDAGCAVANSVLAAEAGALQVQGTINGYGERCGNADLVPIVANLSLKLDRAPLPDGSLERLTETAHVVAEIANIVPDPHQPYAGRNAFAHKAGLHVSAIVRRPDAYEHVEPGSVGNSNHIVVSDLAGRANLLRKAEELGVALEADAVAGILSSMKDLEARGYAFEAADASLELFLRRATGWRQELFAVETFRILVEEHEKTGALAEATVKARLDGERHIETAEGQGPVGALDNALRLAIGRTYPDLEKMELTDYRVRVLDGTKGTGAVVRVLIEMTDGEREWTTVGVSENIIQASYEALAEAYTYGLLPASLRPAARA
jgi:2-isopropylmalate synthase